MHIHWNDLRHSSEVAVHDVLSFPRLEKEQTQLVSLSPVDVDLHAVETDGICRVHGTLETDATFRCSRCVGDFPAHMLIPFEEEFVREELDNRDAEETNVAPGETIDLDPYIEQAIILAFPYRPLCTQECKGLCPDCGINRNEHECDCQARRIDPRMADLAKFFDDSQV